MENAHFVYIGTYTEPILFGTGKVLHGRGEGIYIYRMDRFTGKMEPYSVLKGVPNPSYLAFDYAFQHMYAVNELKVFEKRATGAVSSFRRNPDTGELTFLNRKPTLGTDPCHLIVDRSGKHVLVSNFMSGSVCVLPVGPDGSLGDATDFIQHEGSSVDRVRQNGPHAHSASVSPDNRFAFIPDLGLDKLMIYEYDTTRGKLNPHSTPWVEVSAGAGPRDFVFHPSGTSAYLINELDSSITVFNVDLSIAALRQIQTVPTLPRGFEGDNTCACVGITPSGRFLYGSNRGHDSIAIFRIDSDTGKLEHAGHESTRGRTPRHFEIDPEGRFLIAANQDSNTLVTFAIDQGTGRITASGTVTHVPTPVCVKIVPAAERLSPK